VAGAQDAKPAERTLKVNQVARVSESVITAETLIERITEIERGLDPEARVAKAALDMLVAERLLELEADRLEATVKAREIGDEMAVIEKSWRDEHTRENEARLRNQRERGVPEDPESWEGWLQRRTGMKPAEFGAWLRPTAARNIRLRLVVGYWEKSSENAEAWGLRCENEKTANELRSRILKGENFSTLARGHSNESRSRDNGGNLGSIWPRDGRLDSEVDTEFWKLKDGETSKPIKTEQGWWIVQRRATVLANEAPFYELRESLIGMPNVDNNRFQAWRNAVASSGRYKYERRVPGWDCAADQP
jgi:foldase protein PrsA